MLQARAGYRSARPPSICSNPACNARCHKRTHAPQQTVALFDNIVSAREQRRGANPNAFAVLRLITSSNPAGSNRDRKAFANETEPVPI
jgi:hypothetical protein